jgi:hypothetical protein
MSIKRLSRREVLRAGSALLPAIAVPGVLFPGSADAQTTTSTFDFYISPSGSDSNAGTQASPWSITALNTKQTIYSGKRVGLLPGTYGVGSLMSSNRDSPALRINGGTAAAPTVIAATSRGQAVIAANNGAYGGGTANTCAVLGHKSTAPQQGYVTIDGLKFTGGSYQVIEMGNYDFSGPVISGIVIRNCEFTNNNCANTPAAVGGNCAQISIYKNSGTLLSNNYHHDNYGDGGPGSADHFSALYQWQSSGTTIEYCTLVNSGNLHGKEGSNQGTTIRYCYIDVSSLVTGQNQSGIQGFDGATTGGMTQRSAFHHNVIVFSNLAFDLQSELNNGGWTTPLAIYNNTLIAKSGWSTGIVFYEQTSGSRLLTAYNNLFFLSSASSGYGYSLTNKDAFSLVNYNLYGTSAKWTTVGGGAWNSIGAAGYSSMAAWQAAIAGAAGADANSPSALAVFSNAGANALQYQVSSGPAYQAGRVGGVSSGSVVNIGAWDGTVSRIGYDSQSVIPGAPVLSVS